VTQSTFDSQVLSGLKSVLSSQPEDHALENAVQLLKESSNYYDWIGIYLVKGENLALAAYVGEGETEHVQIPIGQGICGLAAKQAESIIVDDVNKDPRYLMCFPSTRSEIVVPIIGTKNVLGEIDIDSNTLSAFTRHDQELLERAAVVLAEYLEKRRR
jgi:L-methionine (R)-S-oxide reductase